MDNSKRIAGLLAAAIQTALLVAALRDIKKRSADELRGNKWMWVAISFINFIGPISYFALGRKPQEEIILVDDE